MTPVEVIAWSMAALWVTLALVVLAAAIRWIFGGLFGD